MKLGSSVLVLAAFAAFGVFLTLATWSSAASAQEDARGVHTMPVIVIHGRYVHPIAAVEVARATAAVELRPLDRPLVARIEDATRRDPY
jgi:hypothetical protein